MNNKPIGKSQLTSFANLRYWDMVGRTFDPLSRMILDRATGLLRRSLAHMPKQVRLTLLDSMSRRRLSQTQFWKLCAKFGEDRAARARHFVRTFHCRAVIDPQLVRIIKKLQSDFQLENFVETGTFDGDTSFMFSFLFDRVFTCDSIDHPRRVEFYLRDNLIYETKSSPDFLRSHLAEIRHHSLFYLDAHWETYWPLRDELAIVTGECNQPVIVLDDFDAGHGLEFDTYGGQKLDYSYIADLVPAGYRFFINPSSNRNKGMIFLVPASASYGCPFTDRKHYCEKTHGLWNHI